MDSETGYYYYGARFYDPKTSIWLSVDPLAEKYPNVNPYVYCFQNPVKLVDPDGMMPIDPVTRINRHITVGAQTMTQSYTFAWQFTA